MYAIRSYYGILEQIVEQLPQSPDITLYTGLPGIQSGHQLHPGIDAPVKFQYFLHQHVQVDSLQADLWHPRIFTEGVDHFLHGLDLVDYGARCAVQHLDIILVVITSYSIHYTKLYEQLLSVEETSNKLLFKRILSTIKPLMSKEK